MNQTASKQHLTWVEGGREVASDPTQLAMQKSRMQIATALLTVESRQKWVDYEVYSIWQKSASAITAALTSRDIATQKNVQLTSEIRDAYLTSIEVENTENLDRFMIMAAILASLAYDIINEKLADKRPINYRQAHTSSDLFKLNSDGTSMKIKTKAELAKVISGKDFMFDTSTFEKEVANAVVSTLRRQLGYYRPRMTEARLRRYLLSVFTAFNQRKLLVSSPK